MKLFVSIAPKKVAQVLVLVVLCLVFLSFVGRLFEPVLGEFVKLIAVGSDLSVPSWYSSVLLLFSSLLVATIALTKRAVGNRRYLLHWAVLSMVFLYLSMDEMLRLHERASNTLVQPTLKALGYEPGGVLNYTWVVLYGPLVLVLVVVYLKFWVDLPARIRLWFFVAGTLYVGGGILAEMFNAWYDSVYGRGDLFAAVTTHLEESLEMLGVVAFVYALMSYIGSHLLINEVQVRVGDKKLD